MNARHTEFFGPDLARGPHPPQRIETAAIQIATALAQLRAPLQRDDEALRNHADFIRELADRLVPDAATQLLTDVGAPAAGQIQTSIRATPGLFTLLDCWLTDSIGGGLTAVVPTSVTWNTGLVLQTVIDRKFYRVLTPHTGIAEVTVAYGGSRTWYWALARSGRVYTSYPLEF